ncbi:tripartite tricarboxylate transporter TctB family protein [Devosia sp. A449]
MRIHDGLLGLVFIALGITTVWQAASFPGMPGQAIGPGTFPMVFGGIFILGGLIISGKGLMAGAGRLVQFDEGWRHPKRAIAAGIAILGSLLLAIFFEQIGFIIGGSVILIALYWVQGYRSLVWIAVSLGFVGVVYYAMAKLLLVPLPTGPLF